MKSIPTAVLTASLLALVGCASSYSWSPRVPQEMRTVSVPTFRNESKITELGPVMARQVLREFQREGTFRVGTVGDTALEVQGCVKDTGTGKTLYDRHSGLRVCGGEMTADVEISVIDKRSGRVLVDNRLYTARASYTSGSDVDTAFRDASGRLADDLSRQVVDDVLNLKW